jgi:mRNA interferase MazF
MTMSEGQIVLVKFPFSDLESTKKRPALVIKTVKLTHSLSVITLAMVSSRVDGLALEGDVRLKDWQSAKLLHPSMVRLSKIASVDDALIEKVMGSLSDRDLQKVRASFRKQYSFWCKK